MAPKAQEPKSGGKGKITVVMFQLEGSDDTLRDAIKVLGQGIDKLAPNYRLIQAPQSRPNGALTAGSESLSSSEPEVLDPEPGEIEENDAGPSIDTDKTKQPRKRILKAIPAVKGIDWETAPGLRDYAKQKSPDSSSPQRFVVVAGWFRNHRTTEVITPGHIVAAYDLLDWDKPENIPNTFAVLKTRRGGELFDKGEKTNEWVLSQRGINLLDKLGKEKSE